MAGVDSPHRELTVLMRMQFHLNTESHPDKEPKIRSFIMRTPLARLAVKPVWRIAARLLPVYGQWPFGVPRSKPLGHGQWHCLRPVFRKASGCATLWFPIVKSQLDTSVGNDFHMAGVGGGGVAL